MSSREPVYDLGEVTGGVLTQRPPRRAAAGAATGAVVTGPVATGPRAVSTKPAARQGDAPAASRAGSRTTAARAAGSPSRAARPTPRGAGSQPSRPAAAHAYGPRDWRPAASGTLSLFVPGLGQIARGDVALGLMFASLIGFAGATAWAVVHSFEALTRTLPLLGIAPQAAFWTLEALFIAAAVLHIAAVHDAVGHAFRPPWSAHPLLAGLASAAVPGWGQVLRVRPWRAAAFVALCWYLAGAWLLSSGVVLALFDSLGLYLPFGLQFLAAAPGRWAALAVIWVLSVYDAAATSGPDLPGTWSLESRRLLRS